MQYLLINTKIIPAEWVLNLESHIFTTASTSGNGLFSH